MEISLIFCYNIYKNGFLFKNIRKGEISNENF